MSEFVFFLKGDGEIILGGLGVMPLGSNGIIAFW